MNGQDYGKIFELMIGGLFVLAILVALVVFNLALIVLKLFGLLLLSWWWIVGFLPAVFLLFVLVKGIRAVLK